MIRDAKLRALIEKGPSYWEQGYVDWRIREKLCREAVSKYKHKWSRKEKIDVRVLQWKLQIKDKLVHRPMSAIRRMSCNGFFCQKSFILHFYLLHFLYFTLYDILDRIQG